MEARSSNPHHGRPPAGETRQLAEFTSSIAFAALPAAVVERAKQVIADSLACGIGGYSLAPEIALPIRRYATAIGGSPEATLIGGGGVSQPVAALANGTIIHTLDYDDTHMPAIAHFGAPVTAAALAALEHRNGDGRELIASVIAGFEAGGRVGRAALPGHYQRWHSTASLGGIAAAAAVSRALRLDARRTDMAISFAADEAGGTRYCIKRGDFSKSLHAGTAAWRGSQGALLAECGAEGPTGLLEHPVGFFWAYSDEGEPSRLAPTLQSLGSSWEILEDDIKALPSIHASHTAVEATIDLVSEHNLKPGDVNAIHVTHPFYSDNHAMNYEPENAMSARLSLPFCVAAAVVDRRLSLRSFEEERYRDPVVRRLMRRIRSTSDEELNARYPDSTMSIVEIETDSGARLSATRVHARGSHHRPLSASEHQTKLEELLSRTLSDSSASALLDALAGLESLSSLEPITARLNAHNTLGRGKTIADGLP